MSDSPESRMVELIGMANERDLENSRSGLPVALQQALDAALATKRKVSREIPLGREVSPDMQTSLDATDRFAALLELGRLGNKKGLEKSASITQTLTPESTTAEVIAAINRLNLL